MNKMKNTVYTLSFSLLLITCTTLKANPLIHYDTYINTYLDTLDRMLAVHYKQIDIGFGVFVMRVRADFNAVARLSEQISRNKKARKFTHNYYIALTQYLSKEISHLLCNQSIKPDGLFQTHFSKFSYRARKELERARWKTVLGEQYGELIGSLKTVLRDHFNIQSAE